MAPCRGGLGGHRPVPARRHPGHLAPDAQDPPPLVAGRPLDELRDVRAVDRARLLGRHRGHEPGRAMDGLDLHRCLRLPHGVPGDDPEEGPGSCHRERGRRSGRVSPLRLYRSLANLATACFGDRPAGDETTSGGSPASHPTRGNTDVRNYLIVANQTLGGDALAAKVRRVLDDHGPCRFHIVVPATRVPDALTWTSGTARALARGRLERAIARFESMGLEVTGEVADESP